MSAKDDLTKDKLEEVAKEISTERSEKIITIVEKLKEEGKRDMVKNLLDVGVKIDKIVKASGLSEKEVKKIKKKTQH
ncbi:hypothetical protein JCM16358_20610 [Halanaerocella petrolearia]